MTPQDVFALLGDPARQLARTFPPYAAAVMVTCHNPFFEADFRVRGGQPDYKVDLSHTLWGLALGIYGSGMIPAPAEFSYLLSQPKPSHP